MINLKYSKFTRSIAFILSIILTFSIFLSCPIIKVNAASNACYVYMEASGAYWGLSGNRKFAQLKFTYGPYQNKPLTEGSTETFYDINNFYICDSNGNNKKLAYCIAPGVPLHHYSRSDWSTADKQVWKDTGAQINNHGNNTYFNTYIKGNRDLYTALGYAMYYGYGGQGSVVNKYNKNSARVATQMIIWDLIVKNRDNTKYDLTNKKVLLYNSAGNFVNYTTFYDNIYVNDTNKMSKDDFGKATYDIIQAMKNHRKAPAFEGGYTKLDENAAKKNPIILEYNQAKKVYTTTIKDGNKVLSRYGLYNYDSSKLTITKDTTHNTITISTKNNITSPLSIKLAHKDINTGGQQSSTKLQHVGDGIYGNYNNKIQCLSDGFQVDPVNRYIAVKTAPTGSIEVTKNFSKNGTIVKISDDIRNKYKYFLKVVLKDGNEKLIRISKTSNGNYKFNDMNSTNNYYAVSDVVNNGNYYMTLPSSNSTNYKINITNLPQGKYRVIEYEDNNYYRSGYYVLNGNNKTVTVTGTSPIKTSFTNYSTEATITKEFDDPNMTNDDYKSVRLKLQVMYKDSTDNNKLKTGEVYFAQDKNNITDYTFDSFKSTASSGFDSNNYNRTRTIQFASKVKNTAYIHGLPIKNVNGDSLTYKVIEIYACNKEMHLSSDGTKSENKYFTFNNITFTVSKDNVSKAKAKQIKTENHDNDIYQIDIKKKFTRIYNDNKQSLTKNEINELLQDTKFSIYKYNNSTPLKLKVSGNDYNYDTSGTVTQFALKYQSDGINNLSITSIKNLPKGKYTIKEVSHPSGYIPKTTSFVVEVNINNDTKTVSFENVKEESSDIRLHVEKDFVSSNGQRINVPSTNVVANNKLYIAIVADVQVAGTTSKSTRLLRLGWSDKFKGYVYYDGLSTDDKKKYFGNNYSNTVSLSYLVQLKEMGSNKYGFDVYGLPKDTYFDVIEVMYGSYFYNAFEYKNSTQQWGFNKTSGEVLSGYTKVDIPTSKANQTNISSIRKIVKNGSPDYTYEYYSKNSDNIVTFRSTQWNHINKPTSNSNNVVAKLRTKFENEAITSSITIKKTSEDEDVERQFKVTGYYRNKVTDQDVYDNPIIIKTIKKSNGTYGEATVSDLPVYAFCDDGKYVKHYTIEEINCPNRYILPKPQTVQLIKDDIVIIPTVEFHNTLRKASINVLKVGKKINRKINRETVEYETIEEPLKDVYFVLKDQDGNYYDKNGKQYLTQNDPTILRTDSNGKININNLVIEKAVKNNNGKIKIVKMKYSLIEERSEHNYHNVNLKDSSGNKIGLLIPENESDRTYNIVFNLDDYTNDDGDISTTIVHEEKIYNEYIYGALTLTKYDADTNLPLMDDNIKFVVDRLNTNNKVIETIPLNRLVDEDNNNTNIYSVNYLPYGKYLLRESNMPVDVLKLKDPNATFNINANGDFYKAYTNMKGKVSFTTDLDDTNKVYYNFPIKVNINLIKKDSKTNKLLNGAKFNLYLDSNDNKVYDEEDELIGKNIETGDGETGEFVCLGDSDSNKTGKYMIYNVPVYYVNNSYYLKYFVVETEAPDGYEKSDDIYTVTVSKSNVNHNAEYTPNDMPVQNTIINANTILNEKILGSASIVKYDEDTETLLSGAEFTLYIDNNGNGEIDTDDIPYKNTQQYVNNVVKPHLTDINQIPDILKKYYSNINEIPNRYFLINGVIPEILDNSNNRTGRYVICGLPEGNYIIKETNPPEGYASNDNNYTFSIKNNNDLYEAADTYITNNTDGESKVKLSGITIDGVFIPGIPNNKVYKTVQIAKYTVKDFSNLANETFILSSTNSNNHINDRYATANGTILTFNNVHKGGFWIQRCDPETHEIIDNTIYHIDVQQDSVGTTGEDVTIDLSQAHFPLKGAEFTLTNTNTNIKNIQTSSRRGFVTFNNVGVGHYKLEETKSPRGYTKSDVIEEFDITSDTVQKAFRFTFENKPANMNIRLYKVDRYNNTKYLSGAEYTIYKDVNKDKKYTSGTDLTLGTFDEITETLDDDTVIPVYEYKNLEYGTYFIQETKAPPGYTIDPTMHKIYINEDTDYTDLGNGIRVAIMEVSEVKLARLPTAGGIGTITFTIIGLSIMCIPVIMISRKKKRKF